MALLDPERAKRVNREIRDQVVDRVYSTMMVTKGTSGAPTKEKIAQDLDFVLDECLPNPECADQDYFWMGGFVVYVKRDAQKGMWDTYEVLVPATESMIEYRYQREETES